MAGFFDPSNQKETTTTTPSPADQAAAKFRADLLGQLLNASARPKPTFAQFAGGQGYPQMPGGLGGGIADVLSAMAQPGAFTSTQTGNLTPSAPSLFSDLLQGGLTGALMLSALSGSGAGSAVANALKYLGGAVGIGGVNPVLGDTVPDPTAGSSGLQNESNLLDALGSAGSTGGPALGGSGVPLASAGYSPDDQALLDAILSSSNWY